MRSIAPWICLLFFALNLTADVEKNAWSLRALPETPAPLPEVATYAERTGIALNGFDSPQSREIQPGDKVVLLVSLNEKTDLTQWLVEVEVAELNAEEKKYKLPESALYSSTGQKHVFRVTPVAFTLRTHGPIERGTSLHKIKTKTARALTNADSLRLGFDQACEALLHIHEVKLARQDERTLGLQFRNTPFSDAETAPIRAYAEELGVTPAQERALVAASPAISSFFNLAQSTPGLRDIVFKIINLPSAWSLVKSGGKLAPDLNFIGTRVRRMDVPGPGNRPRLLFPVSLDLNKQPALNCLLAVTSTEPPLTTVAGILELYAFPPDNDSRFAVIQVLSARCAPNSSNP